MHIKYCLVIKQLQEIYEENVWLWLWSVYKYNCLNKLHVYFLLINTKWQIYHWGDGDVRFVLGQYP
jgi:hypothetical protein